MKLRIKWEPYEQNSDISAIHVDYRLPTITPPHPLFGPPELEDDAEELAENLRGIHGMDAFNCSGYSLAIKKGSVFTWEEICPRVEQVLCELAGADDLVRMT